MEGYENMKWFELTDEAKNQMSKMMSKNPDKMFPEKRVTPT